MCIHTERNVYIDVKGLMKILSYLLHRRQSQYYIHVCVAASVFGELWRLEPLSLEKKTLWRREMDWLLSVADHIVELVPAHQISQNGSNIEVSDYFESYIFLMSMPVTIFVYLNDFHPIFNINIWSTPTNGLQ